MEKGVWPASCRFAAAQNVDLALVASATRALRLRNAPQFLAALGCVGKNPGYGELDPGVEYHCLQL